MPDKERQRHSGTLHANKEHSRIRHKLLHQLRGKEEVSIMVIRLNKKKAYAPLHDEKTLLYNYVTNILLDRIIIKGLFQQWTQFI
jgi:hypothetical protein